jgi:hypothetical protein
MEHLPELRRGQHLSDRQRRQIGRELAKVYNCGASIRQLCARSGYSISRVRRCLDAAGVCYRPRGGDTRQP